MQLYNTMTRRKEPFTPIEPGHVRLYTCGPTVYNHAHIGNFRAYVFEDILRRVLQFAGFRVTQVMNLTDVDDKTIRGAVAAGVSLDAFTAPFKAAFFEDLDRLGIERAEHYPAATDHIPAMIELIRTLLEKGFAYRSDDGSVYFSVARFPGYGRLAHLDLKGLKAGARVAQDEYEKESVGDFALWKAWDEDDGDVAWDAPWGRGRPGWHIECSAMSMQYLGASFDLHTGGVDNCFPHHENEIAQSESATGSRYVNLWLHCAHLRVEGAKMAKSANNFFTLRDLLERGFHGREIRYVLLSGHYRQPLNFTFDALAAAQSALARFDELTLRLRDRAADCSGTTEDRLADAPEWARTALDGFRAALFDDLNMPSALAVLHGLATDAHRALDGAALTPAGAAGVQAVLAQCDRVLNLLHPAADLAGPPPAAVQQLAEARAVARKERNWGEADRIREQLGALGWEVRDTPQGPTLKKVPVA